MSALVAGNIIDGVVLKPLNVNDDARGSFTEVFKDNWGTSLEPVQFSIVHSRPNVMRGCHLHWQHDEYFCIVKGAASVGLRDERPGSPTRNMWSLYHLCENDMAALVFPRGLVHGWYFHQESIHLQAVSEAYDDYSNYDNHRINWQDPALEIPWPSNNAILTDNAENAPDLAQLRASLPSG